MLRCKKVYTESGSCARTAITNLVNGQDRRRNKFIKQWGAYRRCSVWQNRHRCIFAIPYHWTLFLRCNATKWYNSVINMGPVVPLSCSIYWINHKHRTVLFGRCRCRVLLHMNDSFLCSMVFFSQIQFISPLPENMTRSKSLQTFSNR